ncbi:MAG: translation initiation factor IF-2 [Planctomycetia bacterium]|nr:translation initiation factor IF-2 [Planctomycetia bacterium]
MPVRIYTLAKELKLDSGELSDICTKAGVTGKGSALANLTDDEVARVKEYIAGGGRQSARPAAVLERPSAPAAARPVEAVPGGAMRREDYVPPGGAPLGRPKPIDAAPEPAEPKRKTGDAPRPAPKAPPGIKLAPMPMSAAPPELVADTGPAPQKPDLKLPADAIRAGRAGGKPLSEQLRKHEKKKADTTTPSAPAPAAARGTPAPTTTDAGRDRVRRGAARKADGTVEEDRSLLGGREQRQIARKRAGAKTVTGEDDESSRSRRRKRQSRAGTAVTLPRKGNMIVVMPCTVRNFSAAVGIPATVIQRQLMSMEQMVTINSQLNTETVELLAIELGIEIQLKQAVSLEDQLKARFTGMEDDPADLAPRPPVVTFLGHVDHGKTSLLDAILGMNVVSGEAGGITQHIRAYCVEKNGRKISFVDTPGHEAFTEMRARGANVTDIAVLVVAADDGVMPQTEEAISHARAAGVPIVVALNKIDLPGIDENRILQQLAANELLPSEWGGDVEIMRTSATKGTGLDDLLEMLLFIADDKQFRANPKRTAYGTCLESRLHEGLGVVSKLIVQNGTLRVGDAIICGSSYGRVKAMYDTLDATKHVTEAGPSIPVDVTGLDTAPAAGRRFYVLSDVAEAREFALQRADEERRTVLLPPSHVTLENLFDRLGQNDQVQTLNLILRADVRGSIEAIVQELAKLEHPEVKVKVLQATVGGISEADVHLADASDAIICGFNVVPDEKARELAEDRGVQIRRYDVIYNLTDDLRKALEGMLTPEKREAELGRALVQQTFKISRVGVVAGCRVLSGVVQRSARVRVIRDNTILGEYPIEALKRVKDDAREVREGLECGIKLSGFNDIKEGDVLEVYKVEEVARTL